MRGSETNLISESLVDCLGLQRRQLFKPTIVGLALEGGVEPPILTQFTMSTLKHSSTGLTFEKTYMKIGKLGNSYDIILGSPFLSRHQLSVSCAKHCVISDISGVSLDRKSVV